MTLLTLSAVDEFVARNGQFTLLDWLLEQNHLGYADYESWRYGALPTLDKTLALSAEELNQLCEQAQTHCTMLKLASEQQQWYGWGGEHLKPLKVLQDEQKNSLFDVRWLPAQDLPQMDLFMDNSAIIAENRLVDAMANRQFANAASELQKLSQLNSAHPKLGGYQDLINYGEHMQEPTPIDSADVQAEIAGLESEVVPLASELLGNKKRDYLSQAWQRIANHLLDAEYQLDAPKLHASFAFAAIPDWQAVRSVLEREPKLLSDPVLLARLAEAYQMNKQSAECYWVWIILFDRYAEDALHQLNSCRHAQLLEYWDDFMSLDDSIPDSAFAGYILLRQPGLIHTSARVMDQWAFSFAHPYNQQMLQLIEVRLAEQNEKSPRAALQQSCPLLLKAYLHKRDWYSSSRR